MNAPAAVAPAAEVSRYLDLVDGQQEVYVSDLQVERDRTSARILFKLTLKSAPGHDAPFTIYRVGLPKPEDADFTKVTMDRHVKTVLFPLCGLKQDANGEWPHTSAAQIRAKLSNLFRGDGSEVGGHEVKCTIVVEQRDGKQLDKKGELIKFSSIVSLVPTELVSKVPFESSVNYDDLTDIPF